MPCFEIAVAAPLRTTLTYGAPERGEQGLQPGIRVLAPLGKRLVTGYLLGPSSDIPGPDITIKPIAEILDQEPLFPAALIPFFRWITEYYHYPLGEVIRTALPGGLTAASGRRISLSEPGREALANLGAKEKKQLGPWLDLLLKDSGLAPDAVSRLWQSPARQRLIRSLEQQGFLAIEPVVVGQSVQPKTGLFVRLTQNGLEQAATGQTPHLGPAERKVLRLLLATLHDRQELEQPEISRLYRGAPAVLRRLQDKGMVELFRRRIYRDPFGHSPPFIPEPAQLSAQQEEVLARLHPLLQEPRFQTYLLHGITGSGKTEVYLRAVAQVLEQGRRALILVPEIVLASQLEAHFYSRFGNRLAVLHSGLSAGERLDQWQRITSGEVQVVIGARSGIFAPLENLGLIIVDEEHEAAYKQDTGLCYNGRDLAVLRARQASCPVILGSATPSVTSYHHAKNGRYELLRMDKRIEDRALPEVEVVNLSRDMRSRPDLLFTDPLINALRHTLEQNHQSLLFVNRRGFASFVMCRDCGHIIGCKNCQVSLTKHRSHNQLLCHYCGFSLHCDLICPSCSSPRLAEMGIGSERVEAEVRQHFPEARVARLDSDTAGNSKQYLDILSRVRERRVDILVGTQMIAKGLHFPFVTLVGVIWADSSLAIPDYKASERTLQLLSQVTGRAGRGADAGRVIIQTHQAAHYAVVCAQHHDYEQFYEQEISCRSPLGYPPFGRLVNIRFKGERENLVKHCAEQVSGFLRDLSASKRMPVAVLGPAPAPLARIRNQSRWQVLLKAENPRILHQLCDALQERQTTLVPSQVQVQIDIDPENMM